MLSESFRLVWGNSMTRKPSPASSRGEKWVSSPDRSSTVRGKAVNPYDQSGRQYRVTGRCPVSRSGTAEKRSCVFWQRAFFYLTGNFVLYRCAWFAGRNPPKGKEPVVWPDRKGEWKIMNSLVIVLAAAVCLIAAYALYGRWLARKWGIDPKAKTPAVLHNDGQD